MVRETLGMEDGEERTGEDVEGVEAEDEEVEALRLIEEQDSFAADQEVAYRKENRTH